MTGSSLPENAQHVTVRVEVPRGGRVKRELHGEQPKFDYWSPIGSPFNYGFIEGHPGEDGDPLDALVLGEPAEAGALLPCIVLGVIRFIDAGQPDDKWVCGNAPISDGDIRKINWFFQAYSWIKKPLQWLRGERGQTAFIGFERDVTLPSPRD